jgi:hypothetical protein
MIQRKSATSQVPVRIGTGIDNITVLQGPISALILRSSPQMLMRRNVQMNRVDTYGALPSIILLMGPLDQKADQHRLMKAPL